MNKKGFIAGALVDFYSYMAYILIIIIFLALFSLQGCEGKIEQTLQSNFEQNNAGIALTNYLRTPLIIDGKDIIISDLIYLWYANQTKYEQIIKSKSQEIINRWTYEFTHPVTKNQRIMAYSIVIYSKKHVIGEMPDIILKVPSDNYKSGFCIKDVHGCIDLAGTYLPISDTKNIYVVLWASQAEKSTYK